MGWLWSTSKQSSLQSQVPLQENVSAAVPLSQPPSGPSTPSIQPPKSRDELADAELQAFLSGMNETDIKAQQNSSIASPFRYPPQSASEPTTPPSSIDPDSLYPTTMSCRSAFDYAFFCQSFGGQFVNYYRYGELRDCSQHWSDFWFCMRTKSYSDEERAKMIADRNREKALKWKTGPSSEDIWDIRTEPVLNAFSADFAALEREMKLAEQNKGGETVDLKVTGTV